MAKTRIQTLSLDLLRIDGGTQARLAICQDTVDTYAEVIENEGGEWPFGEIDVFHDGSDYFVADGFHRTLAAIRKKRASVPCRIHQGTAKDARIFGMTANDTHGLRMSQADKRACVEWLLDNGGKMTQEEIASKAGVSRRFVQKVVAERKPEKAHGAPSSSETQGKPDAPVKGAGKGKAAAESESTTASDSGRQSDTTETQQYSATASLVLDSLGAEIPPEFREANEVGIRLLTIGRDVDKFRKLAKEIHEKPGGEWMNMQNIDEFVRSLKNAFQDARLYAICKRCKGKGRDCKTCNGRGWLPDYLKGTI